MGNQTGKHALLVRRIGLTALTNVLIAVSGILLLPVLTRTLTLQDFGAWSLVIVTIGLLPWLVTLELPYTMVRFLAAVSEKEHIRRVFYSTGLIVSISSICACGVLYLFAAQIANGIFNKHLLEALIFPLNVFFACMNVFLLNYFRAVEQMKKYSVLVVTQAYLSVVFVTYLVLSGYQLRGALIGLLLEQLIIFVVAACLILRQLGIAMPKLAGTREYLAFGLPLVPLALSLWITDSSDRYLIAFFLGTPSVGYYSPAYTLGSSMLLLSAPLGLLLPTVLSRYYDQNKIHDVRAIVKNALKYYSGIAIPSFFALTVLSLPLLKILSTPDIAVHGYLVTPFVAAAMLAAGVGEIVGLVFVLKKKTGLSSVIWMLCAILNFGLNLLIIPFLGIIGAALTTLLAFACAVGIGAVYSSRHLKLDIDRIFVLKSLSASFPAALILIAWNPSGLASILASLAFAAAVYITILFIMRGFTIEEVKLFYRLFTGRSSIFFSD